MGTRYYFKNRGIKKFMSRRENKTMKLILIFIIFVLPLSANGQIDTIKTILKSRAEVMPYRSVINDTIPFVKYDQTENIGLQPAFYINGEFSNSTVIGTIDPMLIDSLHIEGIEVEIENKKYYGKIFIKMKEEYSPQLISLTNLVTKYTDIKDELTIFMIDNEIIKGNYDQYLVDEKYILQIIVKTIEMEKENVNVVRLLRKSKENIEKSREIRIRGLYEKVSF